MVYLLIVKAFAFLCVASGALSFSPFILKSDRLSHISFSSGASLTSMKWSLYLGKESSNVWEIDEDTAEIECESSAELARKKEIARLEAERIEIEKAKKNMQSNGKEPSSNSPSTAVVPSQMAKTAGNTPASGMTSANSGAFDFGLLLAFPVIVGTLGLFFVFPLIKDQIALNLPPPMTP